MRMEKPLEHIFVGRVLIMAGIISFIVAIMWQGHWGFSVVEGQVKEYIGAWDEKYAPIIYPPPNDNPDYAYMNKYKFENSEEYAWLFIFHYVWVGGGHIIDDEPVRVWYNENNRVVKVGYNIHYNQVEYTNGYQTEIRYNGMPTERVKIWFLEKAHTPSIEPIQFGWEALWRVLPLVFGILLGSILIIGGYVYTKEHTRGGR